MEPPEMKDPIANGHAKSQEHDVSKEMQVADLDHIEKGLSKYTMEEGVTEHADVTSAKDQPHHKKKALEEKEEAHRHQVMDPEHSENSKSTHSPGSTSDTSATLIYRDATTTEALGDGVPTDRNRMYSVFMYYLSYGRWPHEYPEGFFSILADGTRADMPFGDLPDDFRMYDADGNRILDFEEQISTIVRRNKEHEERLEQVRAEMRSKKSESSAAHVLGGSGNAAATKYCILKSGNWDDVHSDSDIGKVALLVDARSIALVKVVCAIKYLQNVGDEGVDQLNEMLQTDHDQFEDFEEPFPMEEVVRKLHALSATEARWAFDFTSLYHAHKGLRALYLDLRPIQTTLENMELFTVRDFSVLTSEERSMLEAHHMDIRLALRAVYDDLLKFADAVEKENTRAETLKTAVSEGMQEMWKSSDKRGKKGILKHLFKKGMAESQDPALVDNWARSTRCFAIMRFLVLLETGDEFSVVLGGFGDDLKETREKLEPNMAPKTE